MLFKSFGLAALFALSSPLSSALAAPTTSSPARPSATPLPPSRDPWYKAPAKYESAAPGTILRVREAPLLKPLVANCSAVYNILYRTTDSNYLPSWAVTTLFVPLAAAKSSGYTTKPPAAGTKLLSYQTPYDSAFLDDSPSYTLYTTVDPTIPATLGLGWFVSVPDYEGPSAAFTAGVQSGHATLDAIRAVLASSSSGTSPRALSALGLAPGSTKTALYGYSGGALAAEWAAELQEQYAPTLKIAGAALGGLTPNVTSVIYTTNKSLYASLIPSGMIGLVTQNKAASDYLLSQLKPVAGSVGGFNNLGFLSARLQSNTATRGRFALKDIFNYFVNGDAVLRDPRVQEVTNRDGQMGYHGVPRMPVFAFKAIGDDVSVVADTDALVQRYCGVGANILYQRNTVGNHLTEASNGAGRAVAFLAAVLEGGYAKQYKTQGCTVQNVTVGSAKLGKRELAKRHYLAEMLD
jgi:hypothetical protein